MAVGDGWSVPNRQMERPVAFVAAFYIGMVVAVMLVR